MDDGGGGSGAQRMHAACTKKLRRGPTTLSISLHRAAGRGGVLVMGSSLYVCTGSGISPVRLYGPR